MYPNSKRGYRPFPGRERFSSITGPAYAGSNVDTYSEQVYGMFAFSPDGTSFYSNSSTQQRSLATATLNSAYDSTSISGPTTYQIPGIDVSAYTGSIQIVDDGNKLLVADRTNLKIYQYTLNTQGVVAASGGLTYTVGDVLDISSILGASPGDPVFWMSQDGTKLIVAGSGERILREITLTTPFKINTGTASGTTKDLSSDITTMVAISADTDDRVLFVLDGSGQDITQYIFGKRFQLSSLTSANETFSVATQVTSTAYGMAWSPDGDVFFVAGSDGADKVWTYDSPGYSMHDFVSGLETSAVIVMDATPYIINNGKLYGITVAGGYFYLGDMAEATSLATDGTYIVLTTAAQPKVFSYANGVQSVTDSDLDDSQSVAYLDSRFIYSQPSGQFSVSALNDPTSIDASDFATAESFGDAVLSVFSHQQLLYVMGERTIEVWYTSGSGRPPLDRQEVLEIGVIGKRAVDAIDNRVYFLDNQRRPNVLSGLQYQPIPAPALGEEFDSYAKASDCVVSCFSYQNENFAQFRFPSAERAWIYHEPSGEWFKREGAASDFRFISSEYIQAYNKTLGTEERDGSVFSLSDTQYNDEQGSVTRTVDTGLITPELFDRPDSEMIINGFHLTLECSGSGTVSVSLSKDNGAFGTARDLSVTSGTKRYELRRWGKMREAIFRITTTSDIKVDVVDASIDVTLLND